MTGINLQGVRTGKNLLLKVALQVSSLLFLVQVVLSRGYALSLPESGGLLAQSVDVVAPLRTGRWH